MNKSALVETLLMSEKNNTIVKIKIINTNKLFVGAMQKVLNQTIILKSVSAEQITLTLGDIESVNRSTISPYRNILLNFLKTLHACFRKFTSKR
jgi:ferredoxin-fold anticodon binding domain-containing protein